MPRKNNIKDCMKVPGLNTINVNANENEFSKIDFNLLHNLKIFKK